MALIYTKQDLTNLSAKFQCCAATMSSYALKAEKYNLNTKDCYFDKLVYLNRAACILKNYTPVGTVIEAGFISEATLDLTDLAASLPAYLIGSVVINGVIVTVLPEKNYTTLYDVLVDLTDLINNSGTGYTASNNLSNSITIFAPNSGTSANGFVISIQINPSFIKEKEIASSPKAYKQMIYIDNPSSLFHEYTMIASQATTSFGPSPIFNQVIAFKGDATLPTDLITVNLPSTLQAYALSYDEVNDQVYVAGFGGTRRIGVIKPGFTYSNLNDVIIPFAPANPNPTDTLGFQYGQYNPFNDHTYFTMPSNSGTYYQSRSIFKLASDGTQTQIIVQVDYRSFDLRINPANGQIWVISSNTSPQKSIKILNPTTNAVVTTIAPAGDYPVSIAYYGGDGTVGSERMFIGFSSTVPGTYRIASYELDGTLDNASFYTAATTVNHIFYSSIYNVLFVAEGNNIKILRMDGTLKQTFSEAATYFSEDPNFNYVIGILTELVGLPSNNGLIKFFTLSDDGSPTFDGALEGGTPDVLQTDEDNCLSESEIDNVVQVGNSYCCTC